MTADRLTIESVTEMLGRPGRSDSIAILDAAMRGDAASALAALAGSLAGGAEPDMILSDLLDLVHRASLKAAGGAMDTLLESEVEAIETLSGLGIARLGRAWQMLLKGHGEIASAPQPAAAAEMLVIRLSHLANMPTPGDIVRRLAGGETESGSAAGAQTNGTASPPPSEPVETPPPVAGAAAGGDQAPPVTDPIPSPAPVPEAESTALPQPSSLLEISGLAEENGDPMLAAHVRNHVRLVRMQPGLLDISLTDGAPESLAGDMARRLSDWTGQRWMVSLSDGPGGQTIAEERRAAKQRQIDLIAETPLVKSITETFPGAVIETVTPAEQQDEEFPT